VLKRSKAQLASRKTSRQPSAFWLLQNPDSSPELHWWLTAAVWIYFRNCSAHRQKIVTNIPIVANVIMTAAAHPK
jgi:hypothetical protein